MKRDVARMAGALLLLSATIALASERPRAARTAADSTTMHQDTMHQDTMHQDTLVTQRATGTFEVKLAPLDPYNDAADAQLGRMSLDKRFSGDLDATSRGEMLTAMTPTQGSAAYVAVERATGTLHGRRGSFSLQHRGTMARGDQELSITIVPDSGTDELAGIAGSMTVDIADGVHAYTLEYTLPR